LEEQSQFAVGGLVGNAFTGVTVQLYATTDVVSSNYYNLSDGSKSYETRSALESPVLEPLK